MTASSAALYISPIPFNNPVACVRVGLLDGKLVVNPTIRDQKEEPAEHRGRRNGRSHRDGGVWRAGSFRRDRYRCARIRACRNRKIVAAIKELGKKVNPQKVTVAPPAFDEALYKQIAAKYTDRMRDALDTAKHPKLESYGLVDAVKEDIIEAVPEEDDEKRKLAHRAFERLRERIFRDDMLLRKRRPDARAFDQIRQITCEVAVLPRVHGSALFTRGETQALATATLGTKDDMQRLDLLFEEDVFKRFMLHYNFPAFSVGEVKFLRGPGRREVGHGALAEARIDQPAAAGSGFSLRGARGFGHSRIERFLVHGHGLRRVARPHGCRCAAEVAVRRNCHGPGG